LYVTVTACGSYGANYVVDAAINARPNNNLIEARGLPSNFLQMLDLRPQDHRVAIVSGHMAVS
jgi:hypothetical protein